MPVPDRSALALATLLALAPLAGCLGFGSAGSLPAGSIQITNDANASQEVAVTVTKWSNDSDVIHALERWDRPAEPQWTRRWNASVDAGATWTEREAVDEPGAFQVTATARAADAGGNATATATAQNDTAWLGLYAAGPDGEQVAEQTVWIHVDDRQVTISTPSDD